MNDKKNIILLGSTGSIGQSSLRLIRNNREQFNLLGVSAHNNAKLLSEIVNEFDVPNVVLSNSINAKTYYGKSELNIGQSSLIELAKINGADIVKFQTHIAEKESTYDEKFRVKMPKKFKNRSIKSSYLASNF